MFPQTRAAIGRVYAHRTRIASHTRAHLGTVLGVLSFFSLAFLVAKWVYYVDWATFAVGAVGIFVWACIGYTADNMTRRSREENDRAVRSIIRFWQLYSIGALAFAFMLVQPPGKYADVWVRPDTGTTTISQRVVFIVPFVSPVVAVNGRQGYDITERVRSRDDMPLTCSVWVSGVYLDDRGPTALESFLVASAASGNPDALMQNALTAVTSASLIATVAAKTAEEIASPTSKFTIPYAVGTPLYETLARLHLRFVGGDVRPNCRVAFES